MWYVALCVIVWIIALLRALNTPSNTPLNTSSNTFSNSTLDMQQSNGAGLIKRSNFETKPTNEQAALYAQELVNNQNLITGGGLEEARQKMHWMDSITYEDARGLIAKNAMTRENAMSILNF
jgi:hypothetical protein